VVVASVFAEAEREIEGVGAGHGGDVGVEDGAGEVAGGGAGEDVGDEGSGEVLAAEAGADEEAFYLAGIAGGVAGEGPVGDAGSGNAVDEREQDFAVAARVGAGLRFRGRGRAGWFRRIWFRGGTGCTRGRGHELDREAWRRIGRIRCEAWGYLRCTPN